MEMEMETEKVKMEVKAMVYSAHACIGTVLVSLHLCSHSATLYHSLAVLVDYGVFRE